MSFELTSIRIVKSSNSFTYLIKKIRRRKKTYGPWVGVYTVRYSMVFEVFWYHTALCGIQIPNTVYHTTYFGIRRFWCGMVRYGGSAVLVFLKTQSFTKFFLFTHEILHWNQLRNPKIKILCKPNKQPTKASWKSTREEKSKNNCPLSTTKIYNHTTNSEEQ